jgi:ATP sulfurylase
MLIKGEVPPMEFTRPEVAQILIADMKDANS